MQHSNNDNVDITFNDYIVQLQNKCKDVHGIQYCVLQYMIFEQEELLIRFVNELYGYYKKKQKVREVERNNNEKPKTLWETMMTMTTTE